MEEWDRGREQLKKRKGRRWREEEREEEVMGDMKSLMFVPKGTFVMEWNKNTPLFLAEIHIVTAAL